jgi:hypothetical protein
MVWSLSTYCFGIPLSETYGLIGGLVGAAVVTAGLYVVQWQGRRKVLAAIIISPSLGFMGGSAYLLPIYWTLRRSRPGKVKPWFRHLQRLSAACMAFICGCGLEAYELGARAMPWSSVRARVVRFTGGNSLQARLRRHAAAAGLADLPHGIERLRPEQARRSILSAS